MNLHPNRFLRQKTPHRPSRFRSAWKLGLMLPILLPVAFAWLHRAAPAYTLTDLGDDALRAVSGSASSPSGVLPQRFSQTGDFALFSNAAGQVAGSEYRGQGNNRTFHGFLWRRGEKIDLGTLGGKNCLVTGLSASGQVIGASDTSEGEQHAFLWKEGQMRDLGTLDGRQSQANALNEKEEVVGMSQDESGNLHAFLWKQGVMTRLEALFQGGESCTRGLNDRGQIVGWAMTQTGAMHAVLWQQSQIKDLNQEIAARPGLALTEAKAIDAQGQITVTGVWHNQKHTYLLSAK